MKKSFLVILAMVFMAVTNLSIGQTETKPIENTKQEKKISYSFINEYGIYYGGPRHYYDWSEAIGFTGIFVHGICFNKTKDLIGIGIGFESDNRHGQWMPLFVNYRHYFSEKKMLKPLINVGFGAKLAFYKFYSHWSPEFGEYGSMKIDVVPGMYATLSGGFKVKAFTFTSGAFVRSGGNDFIAGLEVKVGFTF